MDEKVVIGGELSLLHVIDGEVGVFTEGSGHIEIYDGELIVTPMAHEEQTLETKDKLMPDNVTVLKVPYYETSNEDGTTVYIASGGLITNG